LGTRRSSPDSARPARIIIAAENTVHASANAGCLDRRHSRYAATAFINARPV